MRPAREVACEYVDACDDHYEVKKHCSRCDELTAAIEARDAEWNRRTPAAPPEVPREGCGACQTAASCVVAGRCLSLAATPGTAPAAPPDPVAQPKSERAKALGLPCGGCEGNCGPPCICDCHHEDTNLLATPGPAPTPPGEPKT